MNLNRLLHFINENNITPPNTYRFELINKLIIEPDIDEPDTHMISETVSSTH